MIVFIHGWMHSARPGDRNVEDFRRALSRISLIEKKVAEIKKDKPRKVIGIYLGWRGKSITAPIVKHFTFLDRKNAAHKMGNGSVINALAKLELIRKSKHTIASNDNKESNTRITVVRCSFGGAAIFSSLNNILQRGAIQTAGLRII